MRIFSDEMRDWAAYTYETFVPEIVRDRLYEATHTHMDAVRPDVGAFCIHAWKLTDDIDTVTFIPVRDPGMGYDVPLDALKAALAAESCEDAENIIISAGGIPVLLGAPGEYDDDEDDDE